MNARNLMLNVVIFEFTFIKATLFVTNVDKMNEFKKIEGQAWSAWKKFIEENKLSDNAPDGQAHKKDTSKETASCMKLPRSDMALFGLCPKTEVFELVVCNYCGSKFKLAAFADHIGTRHSDINDTSPKIKKKTSPSPKTSDTKLKVDNNVQKKGKNKKTKDKLIKPKDKVDSPAKTPINFDVKVGLVEVLNDKSQILSSEADHSSSVKLKNNSILSDDTLKEENKSSGNGNTSNLKPEPIDNKACNGSDDTNTSKPQVPIEETTVSQDGEKVNLQLVVQLIPISTNDASSEPPPPSQEMKGDSESQEKSTTVESTISTDRKLNISDKDNSSANQIMLNPSSEANSAPSPVILNVCSKINSKPSPVLTNSSSKTSSVLLNSSLQFVSKSSPVLFNSLQSNSKQSTMLINSSTEPNSTASTVPLNSTSQRSPSELTNSAKGKSLDATLTEKNKEMEAPREIPVHNEVSSSSIVEIDKLPVNSNAGKTVKSHILVNHKLNKTDVIKLEHEHLKRLATRIRPRLSLPVSIKNPSITNSILTQLQNKVMQSKFSIPIDATSNDGIQDVIKENFVQKRRKSARPNRCFKENSRGQQNTIKKEGDSESPETKSEEKKVEGVTMFYPGCRRSGGLLTSNHNLPRVKRSSSKKNVASSIRKEDTNSSINQSNLSNLSERNEIINFVVNNVSNKNDNNIKNIQVEIDCNMKRPLKLQSKQKGLQRSKNSRKINSQQHKIINNQILSKNKTSICKRLNDNINGAVPAKVKRQEGLMNIVGSVLAKNEHKLSKMNLEVQSNIFEKKVLSSQRVTPTIDLTNDEDSIPSGVEVISGNILRTSSFVQIGSPRMHYFTSSGPLPVTASLTSIQQQFPLKNSRIHLKDVLNPQVNMVPDGNMFIIKKSKTNSSHFNGIEEK